MTYILDNKGTKLNVFALIGVSLLFTIPWLVLGFFPIGFMFLAFGATAATNTSFVWLGITGAVWAWSLGRALVVGYRNRIKENKRGKVAESL